MASKAVYLETVTDLSTSAFLNASKRFISRRGKCNTIHSDDGTNFVGASNLMNAVGKLQSDPTAQNQILEFATN